VENGLCSSPHSPLPRRGLCPGRLFLLRPKEKERVCFVCGMRSKFFLSLSPSVRPLSGSVLRKKRSRAVRNDFFSPMVWPFLSSSRVALAKLAGPFKFMSAKDGGKQRSCLLGHERRRKPSLFLLGFCVLAKGMNSAGGGYGWPVTFPRFFSPRAAEVGGCASPSCRTPSLKKVKSEKRSPFFTEKRWAPFWSCPAVSEGEVLEKPSRLFFGYVVSLPPQK